MDYIQYAIEFLDKNNHGISAGRARDQYIALKARIAQLEAAEQSVHLTGLTPRQKEEVEQMIVSAVIKASS